MENKPGVRIIGGASEENKQKAREEFDVNLNRQNEALSTKEKKMFEEREFPKGEKVITIINFANAETSRMMAEAGIEPYNIPSENYRIVSTDVYKKLNGHESTAIAYNNKQSILFDAERFKDRPVVFAAIAVHETLHLKAHLALEMGDGSKENISTSYRKGVTVLSLQSYGIEGFHQHFTGLHEAIVAEVEKRMLPKILDLPIFENEKSWLASDKAKEQIRNLSEIKGITEDEFIWVDDKDLKNYEVVSYRKQRNVLSYVCEEIQKEFSDQYEDADAVFKEFLKANFTGQLLPIARLVEKTFGEGSFRILGNMDTKGDSAVLCLETLKKSRARHLRK